MNENAHGKSRLSPRMRNSLGFATAFIAAMIVLEALGIVLRWNHSPVWVLLIYDVVSFIVVTAVAYYCYYAPRRC